LTKNLISLAVFNTIYW